jgi:hypothetical protein
MDEKPCGPVQNSCAVVGTTAAAIEIMACAQLIVPPVAVSWGASVSTNTATLAIDVQPFVAVAITVYVPATVMFGLGRLELKLCGPVHSSVLPAGVTVADMGTDGKAQVMVPPAAVSTGDRVSA